MAYVHDDNLSCHKMAYFPRVWVDNPRHSETIPMKSATSIVTRVKKATACAGRGPVRDKRSKR